MMDSTKRILPIALVAALLGGTVGAFVMRAPKTTETANRTTTATPAQVANTTATDQAMPVSNQNDNTNLSPEQIAYRDGFEQGFLTAQENGQAAVNYRAGGPAPISTGRTIVRNRTVQQPAYNHYARNSRNTSSQPVRSRSFWQKHRDKLTVAAGTGGGALIGGLLGGKKGALIGGLAGAGGSALYTYKLRKRTRKY